MRSYDSSSNSSDANGPLRSLRDSLPRRERTRVRVVGTNDGRQWVVREIPSVPSGRRAGSLIFVSEHAMRRVRDYPADWFDWTDADLLAVSLRR